MEPFLILFILDNEVAEQVTRPSKQYSTSVPKHPAMQDLAPLVGSRSLVTTDVKSPCQPSIDTRKKERKKIDAGLTVSREKNGRVFAREFCLVSNRSIYSVL